MHKKCQNDIYRYKTNVTIQTAPLTSAGYNRYLGESLPLSLPNPFNEANPKAAPLHIHVAKHLYSKSIF